MLLPSAPSDRQKYLYIHQNKFFMYAFGVVSTISLATGSTLFALHRAHYSWYLAFVALICFYLGISYFIGLFSKGFNLKRHEKIRDEGQDFKPSVDVYLPCCGEPLEIIANTYRYVEKLDWENFNVFVLDDSANPEIKTLAESHGFTYVCRPNRGELKKAGNIRHAFKKTEGELIVIFDADFCPRPDFLKEIVPYFKDEKVGIVQTPQFFEVKKEMTWLERGAGSVQELFYRLIQVNRDHWGAAICVGTNAVYRRAALAPYGGTYPIQHSEDVHTGFNLVKDGWKLHYVPINLAMGRCPDTVGGFFTQQYRWCMGSTTLLFNRELFWKTKLGFMRRLCYLSGMFYYSATALGLFLTPLPGLLMVWFSPQYVYWYNLAFSVPSFLFAVFYMKFWNREPYGLYTLKARLVSYYAHFFALKDKMMGAMMDWIPTGNQGAIKANTRVKKFRRLLGAWTSSTLLLGWVGAVMNMNGIGDYNFYSFLFFSTFYGLLQLSALWGSDD